MALPSKAGVSYPISSESHSGVSQCPGATRRPKKNVGKKKKMNKGRGTREAELELKQR